MKTTNFEISKKLAEIGFKTETKNWWMLSAFNEPTHQLKTYNRFEDYVGDNYRAYDLETILVALPHGIYVEDSDGTKSMFSEILYSTKLSFFYGYEARLYWTRKELDESLADTAARLLIKLAEQGIINFK